MTENIDSARSRLRSRSTPLASKTPEDANHPSSTGVRKTKMKANQKIPVCIVEQHNDVLAFIHRAIGSRRLPFSKIPFIHLDSHPDLLIPIHLDADTVKKPNQLYELLSIENWLLPLTYAKHVNHVVWIKPPWAHQIKPSNQKFTIGKCQDSGKLRLNCKENYFLTDGLFCAADHLTDCSDVQLTVLELCPENWSTLDPNHEEVQETNDVKGNDSHPDVFHSYKQWVTQLQAIVTDQPYILDMDLDFFSTANPFRGLLSESEEAILKRLYKCPPLKGTSDEDVKDYTTLRKKQLLQLETFFSSADDLWSENTDPVPEVELQKSLSELTGTSTGLLYYFSNEEKCDLMSLCQSLLMSDRKVRDITFNQVHDFGCTLDDTELPHHISSGHQVDALEDALRFVMKNLPKPTIVTISRSSHDDYCPVDKVDEYQAMFLSLLKDLYGDIDIMENF